MRDFAKKYTSKITKNFSNKKPIAVQAPNQVEKLILEFGNRPQEASFVDTVEFYDWFFANWFEALVRRYNMDVAEIKRMKLADCRTTVQAISVQIWSEWQETRTVNRNFDELVYSFFTGTIPLEWTPEEPDERFVQLRKVLLLRGHVEDSHGPADWVGANRLEKIYLFYKLDPLAQNLCLDDNNLSICEAIELGKAIHT